MPSFASRLREIRKDKQLRQKDLADALGLAQTTIANYEQSTRFPDEPTLSKIADFFGVSLDFLLGRSDQRIAPPPATAQPEAQVLLLPEANSFLQALLAGKREGAKSVIDDLTARGRSVQKLYSEIFEPVLYEVGRLWESGAIDVFEEHLVSEAIQSIMAVFSSRFPPPSKPFHAVGVASGGELHQIGLRMVLDFLSLDGWHTRYLGTNLPTPSVVRALLQSRADLLAVSVTMGYNRNQAADLIQAVRRTPELRGTRILLGGRALNLEPDEWRNLEADGRAHNALEAVEVANSLVS